MRSDEKARRGFLKSAGWAGIGLSAWAQGKEIPPSPVQDAAETGHPGTMYDVRSFGAAGDGKTLDTAAINRAIDGAAAAGGGTVYFRAGKYLCYSIHLKSKVALYLDQA